MYQAVSDFLNNLFGINAINFTYQGESVLSINWCDLLTYVSVSLVCIIFACLGFYLFKAVYLMVLKLLSRKF